MLRHLTKGFLCNIWSVYGGYRIFWHILAALITALLVFSGFDWWFFRATRSELWTPVIFAAGIGGFFIPILVPLILYVWGEVRGSARLLYAGIAGAQAVMISWCISSLYKAFTGRIEPEFLTNLLDDRSRIWNFGFFEYGIFWGWPSSHTAVAFALAVAISILLPYWSVRSVAFLCALFIATGAAIGFHWFSDVIAGTIVGSLVGYVVGSHFKSFQRRLQ